MRLPHLLLSCAAFMLAVTVFSAQPATEAEIEIAVGKLLSQMTLAEKLGQMSQQHYDTKSLTNPVSSANAVRNGQVGSFLNPDSAETVNKLQKVAVEESRLKIPLIFGIDVIHGYRTLFPIPLGQSCSWNPELIEAAGRVAAVESSSAGIRWTFAPMLDIARDARWGRIAETLGEDPYLTGQLGAAMVRGFQGKDLTAPDSIAACAKHYVGYGAAEGGRDYNTTLIPEAELRNIYLPSFRAAKEAGVQTFMSAFNDLNGVPTSGNVFTLRQVLQKEWGFDGFVVSDWESIKEMIAHGAAADLHGAARLGINAGVDMEMVSTSYRDHGAALLREGAISTAMLDDSVRRILRVKFRLGLFSNPYTDTTRPSPLLSEENLRVARALATESMVLLKNEKSLLPLSANTKTIAVIGPLADSAVDMRGCWSCRGEASECRTVYSVFKDYVGAKSKVLYAPGLEHASSTDTSEIAAAVKAARKADVVVLCIGEPHELSGEARCRAFIDLPGAQDQLISAVAATGKPIVLVVFGGRPLTFANAAAKAQSILYAWHPGTMAGPAICDLLFGRANPSGKLTTTFPRTVGQIPLYYNHKNTGRPVPLDPKAAQTPLGTAEDPKGYYSQYLDIPQAPAYPFGFGLSYTTFAYSDLKLEAPDANGAIIATVTIANTGTRDGVEVAQLYTRQLVGTLTRPVKELKSFQRVALKAGEQRSVRFELPKHSLGYYDNTGRFLLEPGKYHLWIAPNSAKGAPVEFVLPTQ
ncbi:MAG: beta-glucosidase BglX [Verrucomicrobia bacterium]|nr:beta-glucosidase BglX [Verrucomicrobiota bacterium]